MGASVTYPDGSTLVSSALTIAQINALMVPLTLSALGFASTAVDPNSGQVRIKWPTLGAPFPKVTEDVCFLACVPKDDPYNRIRDRANLPGPSGELIEQWNYTRAWSIRFCHYGPNSTDFARAVRSAMYQDYFTTLLGQSNLFPVSDFPEVVRVPEEKNGQWYERADLEIEMYEEVIETIDRQVVLSVEVIGETPTGKIFDVTP